VVPSLFLCFWTAGTPIKAHAADIDGVTLARRVFDRDHGKDSYATIEMVLTEENGSKRERTLRTATKDYGLTMKSLIQFVSPASIEGTSFLTWENDDRDDDQFLYLPALRRVRRIVSSQKDRRFANTDYSYEDLSRRKVRDDSHRMLGSEEYGGHDCWKLESIPKTSSNSQYGKRISWIIKEIHVVAKAQFFDKEEKLIKELNTHDIEKIDGIWTVMESKLCDLEKQRCTLLKVQEIQYNTGIPDRVFSQEYLMHSR